MAVLSAASTRGLQVSRSYGRFTKEPHSHQKVQLASGGARCWLEDPLLPIKWEHFSLLAGSIQKMDPQNVLTTNLCALSVPRYQC